LKKAKKNFKIPKVKKPVPGESKKGNNNPMGTGVKKKIALEHYHVPHQP